MSLTRDLSAFDNRAFVRGRPMAVEIMWRVVSVLIFRSSLVHHYGIKRSLLNVFGARISRGVRIKPNVTITFPWKLSVGENSWIGEGAWIDNLDEVSIGANVCISQGAYLCTGNHDYKKSSFDLTVAPIHIENGAWVAAKATVAPGTVMRTGAVLGMQSLGKGELEAFTVYQGNPSEKLTKYA